MYCVLRISNVDERIIIRKKSVVAHMKETQTIKAIRRRFEPSMSRTEAPDSLVSNRLCLLNETRVKSEEKVAKQNGN